MHLLLAWTRRVAMMMVLTGATASAGFCESRVSTSNDPTGGLGSQMSALLGQEKTAIGALDAGRMQKILATPAAKPAVAPANKPVQVRQAAASAATPKLATSKLATPKVAAASDGVAVVALTSPRQPAAPVQPAGPVAEPAPVLVRAAVAPLPDTGGQPVLAQPARQDATVALAAAVPAQKAAPFRFFPELFGRAGAKAATPAAPEPMQVKYDAAWLAGLPVASGDQQWECLAKALYFEARGETVAGQFAVGEVVLNRVDSGMYPRSICGVVHQGTKYACQFSFICDGYSDTIREKAAYQQVGKIAALLIEGAPRALTDGATHFRTGAVRPAWARTFTQTAKIGSHYFHRQPLRVATN